MRAGLRTALSFIEYDKGVTRQRPGFLYAVQEKKGYNVLIFAKIMISLTQEMVIMKMHT